MTAPKKTLLHIQPWSSSGPGLANSGMDLTWQDSEGNCTKETIYRTDLSKQALILFPFFLAMYGEMSKLASNREIKQSKSRR